MKRAVFSLVALGSLAALAGCGTTGAVTPPSAPSHASPTAHLNSVSPALATYSQLVRPILDAALQSGRGLLGRITSREDFETLAADCSSAGLTFAQMYDSFRMPSRPSQAGAAVTSADLGFKTTLSAIDECGMAADAQSKSQRRVAGRDLLNGVSEIGAADRSVRSWALLRH